MADLSKLSDSDLLALKAGDLSKVSNEGLLSLKGVESASSGQFAETGGGAALGRPINRGQLNVQAEPRPLESVLAGATKSFIDPVVAATQLATGGNLGTSEFAKKLATEAKPYEEANPEAYVGGRIGGAVLPGVGMAKGIGMIPSFAKANALPGGASLGSNIAQGVAFGATSGALTPEETGKTGADLYAEQLRKGAIDASIGGAIPVVGKAISTANKGLGLNIGKQLEKTISPEELSAKSTALFEKARESNVVFKPEQFAQKMTDVGAELRTQGYTPAAYPKITGVLEELQNQTRPKDFTELQALRKIIQGAQASIDPTERRLASILKTQFDDYIATAPESAISAGTKEGITAWKEARDVYSKLSKADVFDEMLYKAKLDKSKFTQSGEENSLAMQLRRLAENPKKMRLFTKAEQAEIVKASEGSTPQNMMRFFGKFTPHGPVSGMFAGGMILAHPAVGIPFELGAMASRVGATKIRKNDVSKLAAMMRSGQMPEMVSKTNLTPEQERLARLLMTQGIGTATQEATQ